MPVEFVTHKRKIRPNKEICADCIKIKKLMENSEHCLKLEQKRELKEKRKKDFKNFRDQFCSNPEILKALEENQEKRRKDYRIFGARCRAQRKKAIIKLTEQEKIEIKNFYNKCPRNFHVDHIIPISKGGKHCIENLQYLFKKDNLMKNNKIDMCAIQNRLGNETISVDILCKKFNIEKNTAEKICTELNIYKYYQT